MAEKGIVLGFGACNNLLKGHMESKLKFRSMKPFTVEHNTEVIV